MNELWIEKYSPRSSGDIIGQDLAVKEVLDRLKSWKPGKGIMVHGPSGCGKTALIESIAREKGYDITRLTANQKLGNQEITSITQQAAKQMPLFAKGKFILVDEAEVIIRLNRGASATLSTLIKESRFPVFLIVNDVYNQRIRSLKNSCGIIKMKKVHMYDIMKRLKYICEQQGIQLNGNPIRVLSKWSQGDMRSAINDLQMAVQGKEILEEKDLEFLGYRERDTNVFDTLPKIFSSKNIKVSRKAIYESSKDSDELFLWVETNLHNIITTPEGLSKSFDVLSKADIMRNRVRKQQNWRFKGYMVDLLSGISLFKTEKSSFFQYKMPDKIMMLGRSKGSRQLRDSIALKIGEKTHTSKKTIRSQLPLYKLIFAKNKNLLTSLEITDDEKKFLKSH